MARKPRPVTPIGTSLPASWRSTWSGWKVWPMIYGIHETAYEAEALAFERASRGVVADDWRERWKSHCRGKLVWISPSAALFGD